MGVASRGSDLVSTLEVTVEGFGRLGFERLEIGD